MTAQVVGRVSLPAIDDLARFQIDGIEGGAVERGDVQALLIGAQGNAAQESASLDGAQDLLTLQIDFGDSAGVLLRDPDAAAVLVADDAVGLIADGQPLDDLALVGV